MRKPLFAALAIALAQPNEVKFGDLDLDSNAGKATLDARIRNAARNLCANEIRTGSRIDSACRNDVRKQVLAQIDAWQNRVGKGG